MNTPTLAVEPLWTSEDVAKYLRVSKVYIQRLTNRELIPVTRIGRACRYSPERIKRWIEACTRLERRSIAMRRR